MDAACDCPHLDANDPRCGARLTLGHLDEAFHYCLGAFRNCPVYHRIRGELERSGPKPALRLVGIGAGEAVHTPVPPAPALTDVTFHGRPLVLGATGS